jgi:hypothetical protein
LQRELAKNNPFSGLGFLGLETVVLRMTLFRAFACLLAVICSVAAQAQTGVTGASEMLQSLVARVNHAYSSSDCDGSVRRGASLSPAAIMRARL